MRAPRAEGALRAPRPALRVLAAVCALLLAACAAALPAALASEGTGAAATSRSSSLPGADGGILPGGLDEDDATFTTISRLASADERLDDTLVSFSGEAVGEPVNASLSGHKWVLLQSNAGSTSSIEVLMTDEQVALIENFGSYQTRGSTLRVTGIYRIADPSQTGTLDVTAYSVRVVDAGGAVANPADMRRLWLGVGLSALGVGLFGLNVYLKRRSRS